MRQRSRLNDLANEHVRIEADMRATKTKLTSSETNMRMNISSLSHMEKNISNTKQQIKQQEELIYKKVHFRKNFHSHL